MLRLLLAVLLLPSGAWAAPLISEVLYDAQGSDVGGVFVELYAPPGTSLDGLSLEGVNGSGGGVGPVLALAGSVGPSGLFVVASDRGDGASDVPGADLVLAFDLQNGPDSLVLRSGGSVLDAVGYGSFAQGDVFAGEGTPAPDAPAGSSLARRFADVDSGDNAADFVVLAAPTPGQADFAAVPEPGSIWLALLGSLGLAALGGAGARRT